MENIKRLGQAVVIQAVIDYFDTYDEKVRQGILKDLRSQWIEFLSDDLGKRAADAIEKNPKAIEATLREKFEISKYCLLAEKRVCCPDDCTKCAKMLHKKLKPKANNGFIFKEALVAEHGVGGFRLLKTNGLIEPCGTIRGKKIISL